MKVVLCNWAEKYCDPTNTFMGDQSKLFFYRPAFKEINLNLIYTENNEIPRKLLANCTCKRFTYANLFQNKISRDFNDIN